MAARRELLEEIGLSADALLPAGSVCGRWEGRKEGVHLFELRLSELPMLQLDNREIVGARLVARAELSRLTVTGPVAAYFNGRGPL
jgi:8-oxo-dGTP pyrophosphatase MutT (NUDIX family)